MIEIDKKSLLYSLMKKRGARKKEIKEVFNSITRQIWNCLKLKLDTLKNI
jgi:hypothetical protein